MNNPNMVSAPPALKNPFPLLKFELTNMYCDGDAFVKASAMWDVKFNNSLFLKTFRSLLQLPIFFSLKKIDSSAFDNIFLFKYCGWSRKVFDVPSVLCTASSLTYVLP